MKDRGDNVTQLTNGNTETFPDLSSDGKWIAYTSIEDGKPQVWKMDIDGGNRLPLSTDRATRPSISPDGKFVACYSWDQEMKIKLAILPATGGTPIRIFTVPDTIFIQGGLRWAPDGRGVTYVDNAGGFSNVWSQPLQGGAAKRLTTFTSDQIFRYTWSRDGKLIIERGFNVTDAILMTNALSD